MSLIVIFPGKTNEAQGDLVQESRIGRGACSTVYKCRHRLTGAGRNVLFLPPFPF
jgi:hypothetical protein